MNQNLPVQRANSFVPGSRLRPTGPFRRRDGASRHPEHYIQTQIDDSGLFCPDHRFVCASIIFYLNFLYNPVYEAKSLILVKSGWESQDIDLTPNRRQTNVNNPELLATEVRILQSRELAEKIIDDIKPDVIFPDLEQGVRMGVPHAGNALYLFQQNLSVKSSGGNIIEASFKGPNPAMAAKVVNELGQLLHRQAR